MSWKRKYGVFPPAMPYTCSFVGSTIDSSIVVMMVSQSSQIMTFSAKCRIRVIQNLEVMLKLDTWSWYAVCGSCEIKKQNQDWFESHDAERWGSVYVLMREEIRNDDSNNCRLCFAVWCYLGFGIRVGKVKQDIFHNFCNNRGRQTVFLSQYYFELSRLPTTFLRIFTTIFNLFSKLSALRRTISTRRAFSNLVINSSKFLTIYKKDYRELVFP